MLPCSDTQYVSVPMAKVAKQLVDDSRTGAVGCSVCCTKAEFAVNTSARSNRHTTGLQVSCIESSLGITEPIVFSSRSAIDLYAE